MTLLAIPFLVACGDATAVQPDTFAPLQEQLASHTNAAFVMTLVTPFEIPTNSTMDSSPGKLVFTVWSDRLGKRTILQDGVYRMVFPKGTTDHTIEAIKPAPIEEPFLTLGRGFHHILTTGFQGCTATADPSPGPTPQSIRSRFHNVKCPDLAGTWGHNLLVEHHLDDHGTPTLVAIRTPVPGGEATLYFTGMATDLPVPEGVAGDEYRHFPAPLLHDSTKEPLRGH